MLGIDSSVATQLTTTKAPGLTQAVTTTTKAVGGDSGVSTTTTTFDDMPGSTELLTTFDANFGEESTVTETVFTTFEKDISSTTTTTANPATKAASTTLHSTSGPEATPPSSTSGVATTQSVRPTLFPPSTTFVPVHLVNCGSTSRFTDSVGREWQQDDFSNGGVIFSVAEDELLDTASDLLPMYSAERNGGRNLVLLEYNIPVPNGSYRLRLHWAEIFDGASNVGDRVFHVLLEGVELFRDFDIVGRYGTKTGGYEEVDVIVSDGFATIKLLRVKRSPKINGIEILQAVATTTIKEITTTSTTTSSTSTPFTTEEPTIERTTTIRPPATSTGNTQGTLFPLGVVFLREVAISAGGVNGDFLSPAHPSLDWDEDENPTYSSDGFSYQISTADVNLQDLSIYDFRHGTAIEQRASLAHMYASERTAGSGDMVSYAVPLPGGSGPRRVRLHFAELLSTSAAVGDRLMNIAVEKTIVAANFDTVQRFGFRTGGFLELDVEVNDGVLHIDVSRVKKVCGNTLFYYPSHTFHDLCSSIPGWIKPLSDVSHFHQPT